MAEPIGGVDEKVLQGILDSIGGEIVYPFDNGAPYIGWDRGTRLTAVTRLGVSRLRILLVS